MKGVLAPVTLLLCWAFSGARAVEPVTLLHGRFQDFAKGSGQGVAIDADGRLRLAPLPLPLAATGAQRVWDLQVAGKALWIATGDDGQIYHLEQDEEPRLLLDSPEIGIHALADAGNGGIYAGTSPDGIIYHVATDGTVETVARTESRYVWDLAVDDDALLAATGSPARVIRLQDGESTTWFEAPGDSHVRCLVQVGDRWFASTAIAGIAATADGAVTHARIYEVQQTHSRLILETDFEEITFLLALGDTLFAAATTTPTGDGDSDAPRSALLRVEPGGAAFPIWQGRGVFAGLLPAVEGGLTAVLREPGRVLRMQTDGSAFVRVASVDSIQPNTVARWADHLVIGDGTSGRLFQLTTAPGDSGWFDAPVEDLGAHGHWGSIEWQAQEPDDSRVQLRTRSGNSAVPDDNWSEWSAVLRASGQKIASPAARYLQYRVILRGDVDASPTVRRISFSARQTNVPPRIESLSTFAYRGNPQAPGPLPPQSANGSKSSFRLPQSKSLRMVRWQAEDANHDKLRFSIYLRGETQQEWKLIEQDLELTSVYWDTETMPEGMTQLRLVASDADHNPAVGALQDEYISAPFPIDNSPPVVELSTSRAGNTTVVEASFVDRVTSVRGARYSLDYEDHGPRLAPTDGLFDSRREQAVFELEDLAAGEHVIAVQAWDQLDNVGVARIVVIIE